MVLQKYKQDVILDLVYFTIIGPFLQILKVPTLILINAIFKLPVIYFKHFILNIRSLITQKLFIQIFDFVTSKCSEK